MRLIALAALLSVATLGLSACGIIYKLPTRQGNVVEQDSLDQLETGMTREQVHFLLGTPIAKSPFRDDRWDYIGYYRSPRGELSTRAVSLFFSDDKLARMEGVAPKSGDSAVSDPDIEQVIREEKADKAEAEREASERQTGVVLTPEGS